MSSSALHPWLLLCLILVAPQPGSSYHRASHNHGGTRHAVVRSADLDSKAPCKPPTPAGRPPAMRRCSSSGATFFEEKPAVGPGDAFRLRMHFGELEASKATTAAPRVNLPSPSDYHIALGYGTPVQTIVVGFDTGPATGGATQLQCNPCVGTGGAPCDLAFDPSNSTSLVQVPCGSPDCPFADCSGPRCTRRVTRKNAVYNATFVTDTLTLGRSGSLHSFRAVCMEMAARTVDTSASGIIDFSRDSHSLASQVPLSPDNVTFSYCLPSYATWHLGFLAFGGARPERSGQNVTYATLRSNATHPALYSIQLAGITVAGRDLQIPPPATLVGDTVFDVQTKFTYLKPDVYAVLRDEFKSSMKAYRQVASLGQLDTCYDFTGLVELNLPGIALTFDGGARMDLHIANFMYFEEREEVSMGCLAFAAAPASSPVIGVIGTMAQGMTEMVYDVLGGKIGVIPLRC